MCVMLDARDVSNPMNNDYISHMLHVQAGSDCAGVIVKITAGNNLPGPVRSY